MYDLPSIQMQEEQQFFCQNMGDVLASSQQRSLCSSQLMDMIQHIAAYRQTWKTLLVLAFLLFLQLTDTSIHAVNDQYDAFLKALQRMALAQNVLQSMPALQTLMLCQWQLCLSKTLEKIPVSHETAVLKFWDQFLGMTSCSLHSGADLLIESNLCEDLELGEQLD